MIKKSADWLVDALIDSVCRETRTEFSHKLFLSLSCLRARLISYIIKSDNPDRKQVQQQDLRLRRPILAKSVQKRGAVERELSDQIEMIRLIRGSPSFYPQPDTEIEFGVILRWGTGHPIVWGEYCVKTMSRSPVLVCSGDIQAWPVSQEELVASTCYKTADVIFMIVFGLIEIESWTHVCVEAECMHSATDQMLLGKTKEQIC